MTTSSGQPVVIESLQLDFADASRLRLLGTVETPTAQSELKRQLAELHSRIEKARMTVFIVDVRGLSFVNSSAIRLFVDWISKAESARYKLEFWIDRSVTWHRLSFSVLKSLAPRWVDVLERSPSSGTIRARAKLASSTPR
jgi:hypothetical protein